MKKLDNYNYLVEKINKKDEKAILNTLRLKKYDWNYFPSNSIPLLSLLMEKGLGHLCIDIINNVKNINLNISGVDGLYPIHYAIINNQNALISYFIIKGVDIEQESPMGSPLKVALLKFNMEAAYLLINNGADLEGWLNESLFIAISKNNFQLSKILLEKGADPSYNYLDVSCYMLALKNNYIEILNLLQDYNKIEFEAEGIDKEIYEEDWFDIIKLNNELLTKIYIARGVDINIKDNNGENALTISLNNNYNNIIPILKELQ